MTKFSKIALAAFGILLAMQFAAPQKAAAQVSVGVTIGRPAPVVVAPAPVVVAPPPAVVVYDDAYIAGHYWTIGFHEGWYYDGGTRYWIDAHRVRHYDSRYRDARVVYVRRQRGRDHYHRDNGRWHDGGHYDRGRGHGHGHDRDWDD